MTHPRMTYTVSSGTLNLTQAHTLTHHMVNKPFLLLGLAAKYRSLTVAVINVAADHPLFITLTGQLSDSAWDDQPLTYAQKRKKSFFEPPFRALRGNVRTLSMARWKARGRLYIRRNWTFFAIFYGWDVMSGNRSKSAFFERGRSFWAQIAEGRGRRLPTTVGIRVAERLPFRAVLSAVRHLVLSQSTRVTDRRTELRLPRPPSHYARAVKRYCWQSLQL